jgi:hypothetical protein
MKIKAISLLIFAMFTSSLLVPAQATTPQKSLVIIDTGFDTSLPVIKDAVILEVCPQVA